MQIEQELSLYCDDVWETFVSKAGAPMGHKEFVEFAESAPAVHAWLSELGATVTGRETLISLPLLAVSKARRF